MFRALWTALCHPAVTRTLCQQAPFAGLDKSTACRYLSILPDPLICAAIPHQRQASEKEKIIIIREREFPLMNS